MGLNNVASRVRLTHVLCLLCVHARTHTHLYPLECLLPSQGALLLCTVPKEQMQRAVFGLPPELSCLPRPRCVMRSSFSLGHMVSITVLKKPRNTSWMLCRIVRADSPSPFGIAVFHPLGSPFLHSHFLPRSYLSFKDRPSSSISDS